MGEEYALDRCFRCDVYRVGHRREANHPFEESPPPAPRSFHGPEPEDEEWMNASLGPFKPVEEEKL